VEIVGVFAPAVGVGDTGAESPAPLLAAYPNPGNPRLVIAATLPRTGAVTLDIVDVAGRRVRRLVHGHRPAGSLRVAWSGDDDAGRPAPSGAYIAVLRLSETVTSTRLSLIR
jgi:hypothetical protein